MTRPDQQVVCKCLRDDCEESVFVSFEFAVRIRDEELMLILDDITKHPVGASDELVDVCEGKEYSLYKEKQ